MSRTIAVIVVAIAPLLTSVRGPDRQADVVPPSVIAIDADPDELRRVDDAVALFVDSGLTLPDLEVVFSDDMADCHGHYGWFRHGGAPQRIVVCSDLPFVLPHELGHAWVAANLTDLDRDRYRRARGLTNWNDRDSPWMQRGTEDAAFIIQQNLTAAGASMRSSMWRERAEAFELLTGRVSPLRR